MYMYFTFCYCVRLNRKLRALIQDHALLEKRVRDLENKCREKNKSLSKAMRSLLSSIPLILFSDFHIQYLQ